MVAPEWISTDIFNWVVLPLLIAIARILDISVGTVRLIFVSRGYKYLAPLLGFVEVIIWLLAIGQIMQQLDNFMSYIGYGAGFAMGNYIGIILVEKMSIGTVLIRVLPKFDTSNLIKHLREANFGVTSVDAESQRGTLWSLHQKELFLWRYFRLQPDEEIVNPILEPDKLLLRIFYEICCFPTRLTKKWNSLIDTEYENIGFNKQCA